MKKVLKYLGAGLALALTALLLFVAGVSEVRYAVGYKLFPEMTRNAAFDKHTAPSGATVYHLGTIHGQHLQNAAFGLEHLQAVIENLKPSLVIVEVLPEEIERGNPGSGPVEMPVVTLIAKRAGVPVAGIDWWTDKWLLGQSTQDRDDKIFENLQAVLPPSGRILVLTGFSHLLEFRARYKSAGFSRESFSDEEKKSLFAGAVRPFCYPDGLDELLGRAIQWAETHVGNTTDNTLRENFDGKKQLLEEFRAQIATANTCP